MSKAKRGEDGAGGAVRSSNAEKNVAELVRILCKEFQRFLIEGIHVI